MDNQARQLDLNELETILGKGIITKPLETKTFSETFLWTFNFLERRAVRACDGSCRD